MYLKGRKRKVKTEISSGEICAVMGLEGFDIGDTLLTQNPEPLASISIDEPTMSMIFTNNTSPFLVKK